MTSTSEACVHEVVRGRFGQLSVSDAAGIRSLLCNANCHGSAWLDPPVVLAGELFSPGPVPEAGYLLGWLVAAAAAPEGHVLMAGLGSGAGPIALAWSYPRLRITVAEIDPAIIGLARRHFPLLPYYEQQGRLRVLAKDVLDVVWHADAHEWSVACLDAFQTDEDLYCPSALLQSLHGRADALWLNILEQRDYEHTRRHGEQLIDCGWQPLSVLPVHDSAPDLSPGNVLLGTQPVAVRQVRELMPFRMFDHRHAVLAQARLSSLLAQARPWSDLARQTRDDD